MSLSSRAARGAVTTLAGQGLRFLVQLASVTVLARLLVPEDYGLFAMVVAVVGVASVIGDFGLSMAAIQAKEITRAQRSNLFWTNVVLGAALTGGILVLAAPLAEFYGRPEVEQITQAIAPLFLLNSIAAQFRAEASRNLRFAWLAAADVCGQVAGLAAAIAVALTGGGYWALVAQQLVVAAFTVPVLMVASRWLPGRPRRHQHMSALLGFGANTFGVQLLIYVTSNIDNVLIGKVAGSATLGTYNRAYQMFRLPLQQVAAPLTRVAMPVLSRIQDDDERYAAYLVRAQLLLTYGFGGLFFVLACLNDPIIDILLGDQWEAAKPLFVILSVGGVFQAMGYVYYWIFLSRALTGLQLRITIVGRSAMVAAMVVGTAWGATGVAVAASAGQALVWGINTWFALPRTGVARGPLLRTARRPLLLFSVMTAGVLWLSAQISDALGPWQLLGVLCGVMSAYLASACAFSSAVRADVGELADTVRRVRNPRVSV